MLKLTISGNGRALTKEMEGLQLHAYQDPGGVWTIGYGQTGPTVHGGLTITLEQAEAMLTATLATIAAAIEGKTTRDLLQQELDALTDFAFNEGLHALFGSTLWVVAMATAPPARIDHEFMRWTFSKVGGRFQSLPSLERRRAAESKLYQTGSWA